MITDKELYELEILLIAKYQVFDFDQFPYNKSKNEITISENSLKTLVKLTFPERYRTDKNNNFIISLELLNILKLRYFRDRKIEMLLV
ncbi:MAG: hypothetical protein ACYCZ2_18175 [Lutibacter sp.]